MEIIQHNNYNTTIKCMAMIKKDTQDLKTTELKLSKKNIKQAYKKTQNTK